MQRKMKYIVINTVEPMFRISKTWKIKFVTIWGATVAKIMIFLLGDLVIFFVLFDRGKTIIRSQQALYTCYQGHVDAVWATISQ